MKTKNKNKINQLRDKWISDSSETLTKIQRMRQSLDVQKQMHLKVGDVVYFNSGSPPMTVISLQQNGPDYVALLCYFYQGHGKYTRITLDVRCLTKSEDAAVCNV